MIGIRACSANQSPSIIVSPGSTWKPFELAGASAAIPPIAREMSSPRYKPLTSDNPRLGRDRDPDVQVGGQVRGVHVAEARGRALPAMQAEGATAVGRSQIDGELSVAERGDDHHVRAERDRVAEVDPHRPCFTG